MSLIYEIEYTDTYAGEANYSWVQRAKLVMPELTHYGYDGQFGYSRAVRIANREVMKAAKAQLGLAGVRGRTTKYGDTIEFRPYRMCTVLFINCQG